MAEIEEYSVRAVERAIQILNSFDDEHPERGVSEIAEAVGLHKATAHRIITTLLKYGLIERSSNGSNYKLGVQLLELGYRVNRRMDIRQEALPYINQLGKEVDEAIDLSVFDQRQVLCIEMVQSSHALTIAASVGKRLPAHCTAGGKLFLAHFSALQLEEYLLDPLRPLTPNSFTDPVLLKEELSRIKKEGYAMDEEELELGVRAVASPIYNHQNKMVASLSIAGPVSRISNDRVKQILPKLMQTTLDISMRLGFLGKSPIID